MRKKQRYDEKNQNSKKKYGFIQSSFKILKDSLNFSNLMVIQIIFIIISGLTPAFTTIVSTNLFNSVYGYFNGKNNENLIYLNMIYLAIILFIMVINNIIEEMLMSWYIPTKSYLFFKGKLINKSSKIPLISYEHSQILDLKQRASDCVERNVPFAIQMGLLSIIRSGIAAISTVAVLVSYNFWFLPIAIITVIPFLVTKFLRGQSMYYVKWFQAKKHRRQSYLWELFTKKESLKEMRVMGFDNYITHQWEDIRDQNNEELWEQNIKDSKAITFCFIIQILGYIISLLLALYLCFNGNITIGLFGACLIAFSSVQNNFGNMLSSLGGITEDASYVSDYYEFLNLDENQKGEKQYKRLQNKIEVKDVSFSYPNSDKLAINKANLTINKGEKIAILGENGSGKTTLSKILLGIYPTSSGNILYDNVNITEFEKESFYKNMSIISQNFVKYSLTLRENVAISDIKHMYEDEKIKNVLKQEGLDQFLESIGDLDILMGREFEGFELSGGQWQKLAIARALFKDSELIVLDEPTSSLDPLIETEILSDFITIAQEKTAIIISHRVGLCKLVDKIVVMDNGEIVQIGSHQELMQQKGGAYEKLYTSQQQWYI